METSLLSSPPSATRSLPDLAVLAQPQRASMDAGQTGSAESNAPFAAVFQGATEQIAPPVRPSSPEQAVPSVPASRLRRTPPGGRQDAVSAPEDDAAPASASSENARPQEDGNVEPTKADAHTGDDVPRSSDTKHSDERLTSLFTWIVPPEPAPAPILPLETDAPPVVGADAAPAAPPDAAPPPAGDSLAFDLNLAIKNASGPNTSPSASQPQADASLNDAISPAPVHPVEDIEVTKSADPQLAAPDVAVDATPALPVVNPITETTATAARTTASAPTREALPQPTTPAREVAQPADTRPVSGTLNRIGLVVREAEQVVRLDIRQGAEGVRVVVRSGDHSLSQHLRYGLPELIQKLGDQGFDPKRMDATPSRDTPSERDAQQQEQRPRRQQPAWDAQDE